MATLAQDVNVECREPERISARNAIQHRGGAAATSFPLATDTALDILRAGGNAVDAAVAAAWTLCVCEPSASGLGGQTTLLLHTSDGAVRIIDGHSYSPAGTSMDVVTKSQQRNGYRSCTIPSTPATLEYARRKYGVLSRARLLASAIRIAENGYSITPLQHRQAGWVAPFLRASARTSKLFLRDAAPLRPGAIFRQPVLAATLRRLANDGVEDFYHGNVARLIARDMKQNGGLITEEDLANCNLPVEREALCADYRGYQVMSAPPPGGGLQVLLALRIMEALIPSSVSRDAEQWHEAMALAIYTVFREREESPIGPEDLTPSHKDWILDTDRIQHLIAKLQKEMDSNHGMFSGVEEPGDTTHLTVADCQGNVVALTQSIQSLFGAKVASGALGFLYNNYLRTCPRYIHPYQLGSRCQPRSNSAPTLVLRKGPSGPQPVLALGAAGSRRIISSIVQVASAVLDRGLTIDEAVAAPRVHALLNKKVWIERPAASGKLLEKLEKRFLKPEIKEAHSYSMGSVQALQWLPDVTVRGAADPRRDGKATVFAQPSQ